jgi:hypothetical protein
MRLGVPYVTGRAYRATGFPVVNVEFALQRGRQQPLICNAQSGSFQSHRCEGSLFAGGGDCRSVSRAGECISKIQGGRVHTVQFDVATQEEQRALTALSESPGLFGTSSCLPRTFCLSMAMSH